MLALPLISRSQWQRGFDQLPSCPPILFQEDLGRGDRGEKKHIFKTNYSSSLVQFIQKIHPLKSGRVLTPPQSKLLQAVIAVTPLFRPATRRFFFGKTSSKITRSAVLSQVRCQIYQLDFQQENIAKQIQPGLQRIRGIAGSGKTVLLCQKAAMMHLKYPEWDIAVVFFSRSLYEPITQALDQWLRRFSGDKIRDNPTNKKWRVLHAWGYKNQPGLYSTLCQAVDIWSRSVNRTTAQKPNEALAEVCCDLLNSAVIP